MQEKLFEAALGITHPWRVTGVDFDVAGKGLTMAVDFVAGSRFTVPGVAGEHPVQDTVSKRYRHLNFSSRRVASRRGYRACVFPKGGSSDRAGRFTR
jgi:hypothetical protein